VSFWMVMVFMAGSLCSGRAAPNRAKSRRKPRADRVAR
jgi:hypothetical protein